MAGSLEIAIKIHQNGQLDAAEQAYQEILGKEPNHPGALHLLGVVRQQQGRHAEAVALIGRAIGLRPGVAVQHNNYGAAMLSLERFTEADASFRRALAIRPNYADALANLGMAQAGMHDDASAEVHFRRALQCQAWHCDAVTRLASLLERQGRAEEARRLLESALAAVSCSQFHIALGNLLLAAGETQVGVEHYRTGFLTGVRPRTEGTPSTADRLIYDGTCAVGQVCNLSGARQIGNLPYVPAHRDQSAGPHPNSLSKGEGDLEAEISNLKSESSNKSEIQKQQNRKQSPLLGGEGTGRIAFVSPHCVLDFTNGAATATLDALKLLAGLGFECQAFCGSRFDAWDQVPVEEVLARRGDGYQVRDAQIGALPARMIFTSHGDVSVTLVETAWDREKWINREEIAAFLTGCELFLDKTRPDVVWTYGGDPVSLVVQQMARQRGIPILFALHNFSYRDPAAFRMADRVIVPTEFAQRHYREKLGLDCEVLPLVVDPERVAKQEISNLKSEISDKSEIQKEKNPRLNLLSSGEGTKYCTFVNPSPLKGVFVFARIAEVLSRRRPDIRLMIVEGASKASFLPKLGIDLSGTSNVGIMPNTPDARQFLAATKLLLMPSLMENAALVAMEAMLNGIPVLASNRGGLPETIGNAGFLFDIPARYMPETRDLPTAEEVEPWVETIIRLWDDAAEYDRWSRAARERAQQWHPERLGPIYRDFFSRITHQPGPPLAPQAVTG